MTPPDYLILAVIVLQFLGAMYYIGAGEWKAVMIWLGIAVANTGILWSTISGR